MADRPYPIALNEKPKHPLTEAHVALLKLIAASLVDDFLGETEQDQEADDERVA